MKTKAAKLNILLVLAIVIISFVSSYASFEDLETGAKATSLSGAFTAQADDAAAIFYNPAGLARLHRAELFASYEKMFWGLTDESNIGDQVAALAMPSKYGNFGLSWHRLALDNLYNESEIKLSYANYVMKKLSVGLTVSRLSLGYGETKYTVVNPVFDNGYTKSGIGLDLGFLYETEFVNFALAIMNVNEPDMGLKYENKVSREITAAVRLKQRVLNLNLDTVLVDGGIRVKTGIETWLYKRSMALRGGVGLGSNKYRNVSTGVGYKTGKYEVNYSFVYPLSGIASTYGSHQMSFGYRFGEAEEEDVFTWKDLVRLAKADYMQRAVGQDQPSPMRTTNKEGEKIVITPEQIAVAQANVIKAKAYFDKGQFQVGLDKLLEAKEILQDDQEINDLASKGRLVVEIAPEVRDASKKSTLVRNSISAYMRGQGKKSLNSIRYASQLYPKSDMVQKVLDVVEESFTDIAESEKLVPGIDLANQKLQQALELIYAKKYIDAVSLCLEVLELEPGNILAMKRMGSAYWAMNMVKEAKDAWKNAYKLAPDDEQLKEFLKLDESKKAKKAAPKQVKQTDENVVKEYENGINYYKRVKRYGAGNSTLKSILIRMVDKFKDSGMDMSYLQEELKKYNK